MALILIIDTTGRRGYAALGRDGMCMDILTNEEPHQHASFLQPAIQTLLQKHSIPFTQVDAVAVSNGPGSYTGLRVGLASAKGLCFALGLPLITLPTLQIMAMAARLAQVNAIAADACFCPMIDARRMEVFYAVYDTTMRPLQQPANAILDATFLEDLRATRTVCFSGDGSPKFQDLALTGQSVFAGTPPLEASAAELAQAYFERQQFADLAYAVPEYIKAFHSTQPTKKLMPASFPPTGTTGNSS